MDKQKLQTLKGFRDFLPSEKRARNYVEGKVKEVFERFGFDPVETPTLEYAALLLGKYGDEADKLVYSFEDRGGRKIALRYDQTVPTARLLTQYNNELPRYFRRYQIQNVFRADKPQKGRYREFTQCDIDIFNSKSPMADAEILACTYLAFKNVGYPNVVLKINDRQVLFENLKEFATDTTDVLSIIQSIDKLDKMSEEAVEAELKEKGIERAGEVLTKIKSAEMSENLKKIIEYAKELGVSENAIEFSPFLARGLDYYTDMIFEVIIPEYKLGSFGGGGRYDELIGQLGGMETPAVGVAFGFDRMVEAAKELNLIPESSKDSYLVTIFDDKYIDRSMEVARILREKGSRVEIYPKVDKLGKQFKLADQKGIKYVVVIGEEEVDEGFVTVKDMESGEQKKLEL